MSLEIQFKVTKNAILSQENLVCIVIIRNAGDAQTTAANPLYNPNVPVVRVVDVKTGIEVFKQGRERQAGTLYQTLDPGQRIEHEFFLHSIMALNVPGQYDLSLIVPHEGGLKRTESNVVRVEVLPLTPRGFSLVHVQGCWAAVQYAVSVNAASDPPQVIRLQLDVLPKGGVVDAKEVAPCPLRAAPALSVPRNLHVAHSHWIAWIDSNALHYSHYDLLQGPLKPSRWKIPEPEAVLVTPLVSQAVPETGARPPGAALLWVGDEARHVSAFQEVQFAPNGKSQPGGRCPVAGGRPTWMMAFSRSDGLNLVGYISQEANGASLYFRPWPADEDARQPERLVTWPGQCLGGGAIISERDEILGGVLVQGEEREGFPLTLIRWRLSEDHKFEETERHAIEWDPIAGLGKVILRIGPTGFSALLLQNRAGVWSYFDPNQGKISLPTSVASSPLPLDVAFQGPADVVLVAGQLTQGFKLMMLDE